MKELAITQTKQLFYNDSWTDFFSTWANQGMGKCVYLLGLLFKIITKDISINQLFVTQLYACL